MFGTEQLLCIANLSFLWGASRNHYRSIFPFQSLFSTTAFGVGAKYFAFYEEMGVGVRWDNIGISPVEDDQYNLLMVTLMMVLDSLIYAVLVWYIEHVHPGEFNFRSTRHYSSH